MTTWDSGQPKASYPRSLWTNLTRGRRWIRWIAYAAGYLMAVQVLGFFGHPVFIDLGVKMAPAHPAFARSARWAWLVCVLGMPALGLFWFARRQARQRRGRA